MYISGGRFFGPTRKVTIVKKVKGFVEGKSIERLFASLTHLSKDEKDKLKYSSIDVIKKCVDSDFLKKTRQNNTGLVIGKIQSGKTLSFTAVLALARDNGYRIVVVISGRTNLLLKQTTDRLKDDLITKDRNISILTNAETKEKRSKSIKDIKRILKKEDANKMVVIPILKHQGRIAGLTILFRDNQIQHLLQNKSVLIIDDEADQASLNTEARRNAKFGLTDESAIFASIKNLRFVLPNHSYIQYTATPQATLLIDSLSLLSPDWHVILSPGEMYTGGQIFFDEKRNIVENIKAEGEFPPSTDNLVAPPKSLKSSIIEFLILAALMGDAIDGKEEFNNRASMLVHPTWKVNTKENSIGIDMFTDWIENLIEVFEEDLVDHNDYESFKKEYKIIKERLNKRKLFSHFPTIDQVINAIISDVFDDLKVHQVTGGMLD